MVRFSKLPENHQDRRHAIKMVLRSIRRAGYEWEWAHHVERNPAGTGYHLHGFQHGDYVPQAELQDACERAGLGYPDIRKFTLRGETAAYGVKSVKYGMKSDDLEDFLHLNGGRMVHATRAFWRQGSERLTMHEAIERCRTPGEDQGPWVLAHANSLDALAGPPSSASE